MYSFTKDSSKGVIKVISSQNLSWAEYESMATDLKRAMIDWKEVKLFHDITDLRSVELCALFSELRFLIDNNSLIRSSLKKYALVSQKAYISFPLSIFLRIFIEKVRVFKSARAAMTWILE